MKNKILFTGLFLIGLCIKINAQTTDKIVALESLQQIESEATEKKKIITNQNPANEEGAILNFLSEIELFSNAINSILNLYTDSLDLKDIAIDLKEIELKVKDDVWTAQKWSDVTVSVKLVHSELLKKLAYKEIPENLFAVMPYVKDQNYIRTRTFTTSNKEKFIETIQYFDGLGRPNETVQKGITPNKQDLVSFLEYDIFGREFKQWLPAKIDDNNGNFVFINNFKSAANSFANSFHNDQRPFVENVYEKSPLNRVSKQKGAGADWEQHPTEMQYLTNSASEVPYFEIVNNQLKRNDNYAANTLYKTVSIDEDGKTAAQYKDKLGKVVMTSQANDHKTCYVFDDFGNLRYVLPPLAVDDLPSATISDNNSTLLDYAYIYKYDNRNRQISKKLPGCEPIYMVYDKADRLIFSQDGNQRPILNGNRDTKWTYFKYDVFGRLLYTGICTTRTSHATLQDNFKNIVVTETYNNTDFGYSQTPYSGINYIELLTINYYDNYNFLNLLDQNIGDMITYIENPDYDKAYSNSSSQSSHVGVEDLNAKTLLTGTRNYILDNSGNFLATAFYYDKKGQVVQTRATNHLDGFDIVYNKYNFVGAITNTLKEHSTSPQGDFTELYENEYDHAGRLTTTTYTLNTNVPNAPIIPIVTENHYDDLGRLITKNRHSNADTEEFAYNIKNWLTQIKSGTTFQEDIFYNNVSGSATPCFNGNISKIAFKDHAYNFKYDALNRLKEGTADCRVKINLGFVTMRGGSFDEFFTYDKHGNIKGLQRYSNDVIIDNLTLDYNGNQLQTVTDAAGTQGIYNTKEYNPNGDGTFGYDANGNLILDSDRKISTIEYNLLNLPSKIFFEDGNIIFNVYAADGRKLSSYYVSKVTQNINPREKLVILELPRPIETTPQTINISDIEEAEGTHYINNFEYLFEIQEQIEDIAYTRIHNSEGYYKDGDFYCYRKDHLGNNREVVKFPSCGGGQGEVVQVTNYYPSGLPWTYETEQVQPYLFEGKEFIEMGGYDAYDYHARIRMGAIPRFETIDPLCERYYSISPYAYVANRFVNFIDPTGMKIDSLSQKEWDTRKADVTAERDKLQKKKSLTEDQQSRLNSLNSTLTTMAGLEGCEQMYSLKNIGGDKGGLTLEGTTVVISFTGETSNFVHEVTHAGQFQYEGEVFDTQTGQIITNDLGDEVRAYQAQYAYDPSSVKELTSSIKGGTSFATITETWVRGIEYGGERPYSSGGSGRYGQRGSLNVNSTLQDFQNAGKRVGPSIFPLTTNPYVYYIRR